MFDKLNVTLDEQKEIVDGLKGKLDELKTEYEQLKSKDDLTDTEEQRLRLLEAEIAANEIILKQEEKKAYSKEFGEESREGYLSAPGHEVVTTGVDRLNESIKKHEELTKKIEETKNKIIELGKSAGDNSAEISKLERTVGDLESKDSALMETIIAGANSLSDYKEILGELPPEAQALLDIAIPLIEAFAGVGDAATDSGDKVGDSGAQIQSAEEVLQSYASSLEDASNAYGVLSDTVAAYNENGSLTASQLSDLLSLGSEYLDLLSLENGQLVLNKDALQDKVEAIRQNYIAQLTNAAAEKLYSIAINGTEDAMSDAASTAEGTSSKYQGYINMLNNLGDSAISTTAALIGVNSALGGSPLSDEQLKAQNQVVEDWQKQVALFNSVNVAPFSSGRSGRSTSASGTSGVGRTRKDPIEEQTKAFKDQISILKDRLDLLEKSNRPIEDQINMLQKIKKALHDQAEWYRRQGFGEDSKQIIDLQKQWWDAENKITNLHRKAFDDRLDISEKYIEDRNRLDDWGADSEIEAWKRVQEWEKEWYDKGLVDYQTYLEAKEKADKAYSEAAKKAVEDLIEAQNKAIKKSMEALEDSISGKESTGDAYEAYASFIVGKLDEEIAKEQSAIDAINKKYDDQIDAIRKVNDESKESIRLAELQEQLAKAKISKVLVYKDGRYQYVSDIDQVSRAGKDLEQYQADIDMQHRIDSLEKERDAEIKVHDDRIKVYEDYKKQWANLTDSYKREQDRLLIAEKLGIDVENDNWKKRLDNANQFKNEYARVMGEIARMQEELARAQQQIESPDWSQLWWDIENDQTLSPEEKRAQQEYVHEQKAKEMAGSGQVFNPSTGTWGPGEDKNVIDQAKREYEDAKKRGDEAGMARAHAKAEAERAKSGYSGGGDGSKHIPTGHSGGGSSSASRSSSGANQNVINQAKREYETAKKRGDQAGMDRAHAKAEAERAKSGYSGGGDGSKHIPIGGRHATGTYSAPGGLSYVGENGAELRVLNRGDGIIPAEQTKNLWEWGNMKPSDFVSAIAPVQKNGDNVMPVTIQNLNLPSVKDGRDFVNYLKNNLFNQTLQLAHT